MFKVTQWFGENPEDYQQYGLPGHEGLDLVAPTGQPVFAVADGVVILVTNDVGNYGVQIRILHTGGFTTIYAHLQNTAVNEGDLVVGGQMIGHADNTGNSRGSHLHFAEKQENVTYVDEMGVSWPFNFRDPWLHLRPLYDEWLQPRGVVGWVFGNGLKFSRQGDYVRVVGTLNLRDQPSSNGLLLGQVTSHTAAKVLSTVPVNGYFRVLTPVDIPTNNTSDPGVGLHLRADPFDLKPAETNELILLRDANAPNVVKLLHNHPVSVYQVANSVYGTAVKYVIRIMQSWDNRVITPAQFVGWNIDELRTKVRGLPVPLSSVYIELHNEPNLRQEGWGFSWQDGSQFSTWAGQALTLFKQDTILAGCKWVYPGLSPGGSIPGIRTDSTAFLAQSNLALFDVLGVHAYWSQDYPIAQAYAHIDASLAYSKPILLTEVSRNDRPAVLPYSQYGTEYVQFIRAMRQRPNVLGITFFISSASDPYFEPETWVTETNQSKGIARVIKDNL